jgi:hypothetical protein
MTDLDLIVDHPFEVSPWPDVCGYGGGPDNWIQMCGYSRAEHADQGEEVSAMDTSEGADE